MLRKINFVFGKYAGHTLQFDTSITKIGSIATKFAIGAKFLRKYIINYKTYELLNFTDNPRVGISDLYPGDIFCLDR